MKGTDRVRLCEGVRVRGLAFAIHGVLLLAAFVFVMIFVYIFLAGRGEFAVVEAGPPPAVWSYWLAFAAAAFLYFWLCEGLRGQTLGKRLCSLPVLAADGRPATIGAAFWRTLLRAVDWLPTMYLLGAVVIWGASRAQRLGDLAAHTVVVRTRVVELAAFDPTDPAVVPWPGDAAAASPGDAAGAH